MKKKKKRKKVKSDDIGTQNVRSMNQSKLEVVKRDSKSEH